jgi:type IV pilus assembly protein PilB
VSIAAPTPSRNGQAGHAMHARLGDVIVDLGLCDRATVEAAVRTARDSERRVGEVLLQEGAITEEGLATALALRLGFERIDIDALTVDVTAVQLVPALAARRLHALPVAFIDDNTLLVAMTDPSDLFALDDVSMLSGRAVRAAVVSPHELEVLLRRLSPLDEDLAGMAPEEEEPDDAQRDDVAAESGDQAPTIRLVRSIIGQAVEQGASDIHFEPEEGGLRVRYRIDGIMADFARVPRAQSLAVISRIKILGSMDIAEHRLPQDGRMSVVLDGRRIDIRVGIVPLISGEKAVLRVLDSERTPLSLGDLGMRASDRERLEASLALSHGAILATGPTGSGKTTTLYAAVGIVSSPEKTILTIEDPVEYRLEGVSQIQVQERTGLNFSTALRAVVRADPDVIMVGEMRDLESARIGIESALTGHLVLSTLHTNDAPMTIMRLIDMGVEPYLVASAINCIVAQRLVRRLCSSCRKPAPVLNEDAGLGVLAGYGSVDPDADAVDICEAVGCSRCRNTGYRGRIGIYEVMTITEELRALIVERADADAIRRLAVAQGMRRLRDDGLDKVRAGETTLAELARVTG